MENSVNNYNYRYFFEGYKVERVIYSTSNNMKFTSYIDVNEVVSELI